MCESVLHISASTSALSLMPRERALVDADDAALDVLGQALFGDVGQLARVVEVSHQVDALLACRVRSQQILQFRVVENPKRIEGRHFAAEPDDLDVFDLMDRRDDLAHPAGAHQQRTPPVSRTLDTCG